MMGSEEDWKSLHPASVVVNLIPRSWRVMRFSWPLFLAILWRGESGQWLDMVDLGLVLFLFLATMGGTVLHWLVLRYRFLDGRLEIRTGLLHRRLRTIDAHKVQNVEFSRNLFHRLSGLVEVRIETASGREVEGDLSALTVVSAEQLRRQLESHRRTNTADVEQGSTLVENGLFDLFRFGATAMRFGAAFVVFGVLFEGLVRLEPDEMGQFGQMAWGLKGAAVFVAVLSGGWLWGVLSTVVRHFQFRMTELPHALVIEGGLFTRRRLELPLSKVQVVSVTEPLLRRWAGFGSVVIETAASRSGQGGTARQVAMAPVVERNQIPHVVATALQSIDIDPWRTTLYPPHRKALWRAIGRAILRNAIISAAIHGWFGGWAVLVWGLVPVGVFFAVLDHRFQGWFVSPLAVVSRSGYLTRSSVVMHRSKLQSVSCHQGLFMRRLGLGRVRANVAGRGISLPLMGWEQSLETVMKLAFDKTERVYAD